MSDNAAAPKISIIIPTLNAASHLEALLSAIATQSFAPLEIIIVDSSSSDGTPGIVERAATTLPVRFRSISRADFSHGKTRNLAAEMAQGEILVFLTQDALPASPEWLHRLVRPFADPEVACVFGRHLPRPCGSPLIALDIERHFASFGSDDYNVQQVDWESPESVQRYRSNEGAYAFNSNVNSAVRREVWERIRFREVMYSEDQMLGRDIIEAGYKKVYSLHATVYHSHEYPLRDYFKRYFDEYRGLKNTLGVLDGTNVVTFVPVVLLATLRDVRQLLKRGVERKSYWLLYALAYHLVRRAGAYLGGRHDKLPPALRKLLSLEGKS